MKVLVYVLELDGSKMIFDNRDELLSALDCELADGHCENVVFNVYTEMMEEDALESLPEFEGW